MGTIDYSVNHIESKEVPFKDLKDLLAWSCLTAPILIGHVILKQCCTGFEPWDRHTPNGVCLYLS